MVISVVGIECGRVLVLVWDEVTGGMNACGRGDPSPFRHAVLSLLHGRRTLGASGVGQGRGVLHYLRRRAPRSFRSGSRAGRPADSPLLHMSRAHASTGMLGGVFLNADCFAGFPQESMGGTSGVLLEIFFTAAARSIAQGKALPAALLAGVDAIEFYGGASVGSRTMIDALRPAVAALDSGAPLAEVAFAARKGADSTMTMTASAGRANWVGQESYQGMPDPGAAAVAIVLEAMAKVAA